LGNKYSSITYKRLFLKSGGGKERKKENQIMGIVQGKERERGVIKKGVNERGRENTITVIKKRVNESKRGKGKGKPERRREKDIEREKK
jgi:hypothetical protein